MNKMKSRKEIEQPKKYKLKEWEKYDDEAYYHIPHFCPNCGESLSEPISYWADSHRQSTIDNPFKGLGYDCWCDNCHWSGDILPDMDRDIVEKRNEITKWVPFKFKKRKKK
jgi:hypothetical protein